ncbi:hypothetical protein L1987_19470 [Smallanthus sonchifolius]|uniref:Uncharacterized protein n=1 Tax=Smallanthus sonchifolius TaxID=185202 RepID=A0ACB9IPX6_9ASTR|nr:hypothetical protein L1987_19470 [Smallanthus sonchifolius]
MDPYNNEFTKEEFFESEDPWKPDKLFRNLEEIKSQIIKLYSTEPHEDPSAILDYPQNIGIDKASKEQDTEVVAMIPLVSTSDTNEDNITASKLPQTDIDEILRPPRLERQYNRFQSLLNQIQLNLPYELFLYKMPAHSKFLKDMLTKKEKMEEQPQIPLNEECSVIPQGRDLSTDS